ncbi:hypothetical protein CYMTET_36531, partial [Cymbomonas tetramitiformis]
PLRRMLCGGQSLDEFVHNVVEKAQNATSCRSMSTRRNKVPESGMPGLPTLASVAGSVPMRSVAVQAAPTQHQRYYFPDEQALGENKSDRHFFKYFDVTLPNQEVIDTMPTSLVVYALCLFPRPASSAAVPAPPWRTTLS